MAATADAKSLDGDDSADSPPHNSPETPMTMSPMGYPIHMYPFPSHLPPQQPARSKRRQVKNACTNCQKACKKCDDARPCLRCVKYGISEECVDSQRKERKKGIKRGPYKKRDGKGSSVDPPGATSGQQDLPGSETAAQPPGSPPQVVAPYMPLPGFFGQYPQAHLIKPGDGGPLYPQYLAPLPHPISLPPAPPGADPTQAGYQPQHHFYPFVPFGAPAMYPYMIPRPDGQATNYMILPVFPKPGGPSAMPAEAPEQANSGRDDGGSPDGE